MTRGTNWHKLDGDLVEKKVAHKGFFRRLYESRHPENSIDYEVVSDEEVMMGRGIHPIGAWVAIVSVAGGLVWAYHLPIAALLQVAMAGVVAVVILSGR